MSSPLRWIAPALGLLLACADGSDPASAPLLEVWGGDMSARHQNVRVARGGLPVADAVVTVNGQPLAGFPSEAGAYHGELPNTLGAGQLVELVVVAGEDAVRGFAPVPEVPVLTAPQDGGSFPTSGTLAVTWQSATDPDYFQVFASWSCGPSCGTGRWFEVSGDARSFDLPVGAVPAGLAIGVVVMAYEDGALEGDYAPYLEYRGMNVRAESVQVTLTR
jgi:hypothetical protein